LFSLRRRKLDCFASLAMTVWRAARTPSRRNDGLSAEHEAGQHSFLDTGVFSG
jgi:hypothetical protein